MAPIAGLLLAGAVGSCGSGRLDRAGSRQKLDADVDGLGSAPRGLFVWPSRSRCADRCCGMRIPWLGRCWKAIRDREHVNAIRLRRRVLADLFAGCSVHEQQGVEASRTPRKNTGGRGVA